MKREQVEKAAKLASLTLTEEEKELFGGQLGDILGYIDRLNSLDTDKVQPAFHPLLERLSLRDDRVEDFKELEMLRRIAPEFRAGYYRVKKVIE